jgi:hypothetical protein
VVVLHTGDAAVHAIELLAVHCTHALRVASQAGVVPEQSPSALHATHLPWFAPAVAQTDERQTLLAFMLVHDPPPLAYPQLLSVSHTPLRQARMPLVMVHMPLMGVTFGRGWPLATLGVHVPWLHHCIALQSVSVKHMLPHAPDIVLQIEPACMAPQSELVAHLPQLPAPPPESTQ